MIDIENLLNAVISLAPAARTASANGTGVDLSNYNGALVLITTGTITDGTHTIEIQDSSDNSTYAAVADALLVGTEPAIGSSDDNVTYKIGYLGNKKWLRVAVTVAGASTGGVYAASIIRSNSRVLPV